MFLSVHKVCKRKVETWNEMFCTLSLALVIATSHRGLKKQQLKSKRTDPRGKLFKELGFKSVLPSITSVSDARPGLGKSVALGEPIKVV